jgi:hypothetical protein
MGRGALVQIDASAATVAVYGTGAIVTWLTLPWVEGTREGIREGVRGPVRDFVRDAVTAWLDRHRDRLRDADERERSE